MVFIDSPWRRYVEGDRDALTDQQKQGALLFFGAPNEGGAGCAACHNGPLFSDGQHHVVAFPQIGPGKGDGNNDDFGRERETGDSDDRYRFRTASLLNIELSAPYGHAGSYETLEDVVRHYNNPEGQVNRYFNDGGWCDLPQFDGIANCTSLYPDAESNTDLALAKLDQERRDGTSRFANIRLNNNEVDQLVAFLRSLTDSCTQDRTCLADWIADETDDNPDDQVLIAVDAEGNLL